MPVGRRSQQPCPLCPHPGPAHCPGTEAQGAAQASRLLAHDPPSLSFRGSACGQRGGGPAPRAPRLKVEGAESPSLQHLARGSSLGQEHPLPSRPSRPKTLNPPSQPSLFGVCLEITPCRWVSDTVSVHEEGLAFGATEGCPSCSSSCSISPA